MVKPIEDRLVKAKSDQALFSFESPVIPADESNLNGRKSRSLDPVGYVVWSNEPVLVTLTKGDQGLGFSILDYQVSNFRLIE